jgi:hypothetical protein
LFEEDENWKINFFIDRYLEKSQEVEFFYEHMLLAIKIFIKEENIFLYNQKERLKKKNEY